MELTLIEPNDAMNLNRFTLAFAGKDQPMENRFLTQYCLRNLRFLRICLYLSILAFSSLGFWDAILFPSLKYPLWFTRYGLVLPLFLGTVYLTYTRLYPKIWQYCHFILTLAAGISTVAMILITSEPQNLLYFHVIVVVLFFNYALIRARFIMATVAGGIISMAYIVIVHLNHQPALDSRFTNSYFLTIMLISGMFISYAIEKSERKNYFLSYKLNQQKKQLDQSNHNLEQRIRKRTEQLERQIEERKQTKKAHRLLENRLRQSQKMDAIGTLAGGIAHDFNNILAAMIGYTELIRDTPPVKDARTHQNIKEILKAGNRAKSLIRQILTFSRQDDQKVSPVQIGLIVKEVSKLIRATLPATIRIRRHICSDALVMADATQIHQIVMNLCANAAHAMRSHRGELSVSLTDVDIDSNFAQHHPPLTPGPHICLSVSDTGSGIPPNYLDRIFEPFFSTKKQREGTGLGLSVVHGIVKQNQGAINVFSEPGQGATFNIYLPITTYQESSPAPINLSQFRGKERILYVDDEKQIGSMTYFKLRNLGYDVTVMTDSLEAWDYFQSDPEAVDLLITDMTMPNLTGVDLAQKVQSFRPDLPVILCSGFGNAANDETIGNLPIKAVLAKPVFTYEIAAAIRAIFDTQKAA
jgi:signal transduction histidine kinase/CheY-like chemotaxis protein